MGRIRFTLSPLSGGVQVRFNGAVPPTQGVAARNLGPTLSHDGLTDIWLTYLGIPSFTIDVTGVTDRVELTVSEDFSDAVETAGEFTFTAPSGDEFSFVGLGDRQTPYVRRLTSQEEGLANAWGVAYQAAGLPTPLTVEISDGVDDGVLGWELQPTINVDHGVETAQLLEAPTGGVGPYAYRLIGSLPPGLAFDAETRTISGRPTFEAIGQYELEFSATDQDGDVVLSQTVLTVREDPRAPWRVEVDWDGDDSFANDLSDVTDLLVAIPTCKRGRDYTGSLEGIALAGILECTVLDEEAIFDRENSASPLFGKVLPGRRVRVRVLRNGEYTTIWSGVLDQPSPAYKYGNFRHVTIPALGPLSLLNTIDGEELSVPMTTDVRYSDAVNILLDQAGIPGPFRATIDPTTGVMERWWLVAGTTLDELRRIEAVSLGRIHETLDGRIGMESEVNRRTKSRTPTLRLVEGGDEQEGEVAVTDLRKFDPLQSLVNSITVRVATYEVGDEEVLWEWAGNFPAIQPGASWVVTALYPGNARGGGLGIGVDEWTQPVQLTDYDTETPEQLNDVVVAMVPSATSARLTFFNVGSAPVRLTKSQLRGTPVSESFPYDVTYENAASIATYGRHSQRVRFAFLSEQAARNYAEFHLAARSQPVSRVLATFDDPDLSYPVDLSDVVQLREGTGVSYAYFVEQVNHRFYRGGYHRTELLMLREDVLSPELPTTVGVVIPPVPAGLEGTAVRLSATIHGRYDTLTYAWAVTGGRLDDAAAASPEWTRPAVDADTDYTITLTVTALGNGRNSEAGTRAQASDSATTTVEAILPETVAPTVSIDGVEDGREGTTVRLTATLQGGRYDDLDYAWAVTGGMLDDPAAVSPEWTRPSVDANTDYTITLTITARGTGTLARTGTSDAAGDNLDVEVQPALPVASAPTVTIDAVSAGREGTTVDLTATLQGGRYDDLDYAWAVTGGMLDDPAAVSPEWTRPSVDANTDYTITLTITARGTGTLARTGTSDAAGDNLDVEVQPALPVASAPTVTIDAVSAGREGTTVDLTATLQGGRYDDLDYAWAVTGGDLDDDDAVSPEWTRPSVDADTDYTITLTVTARGTGRNARADTEAESTRASRTARVTDTTAQLPVASAPTVTIDAVSAGREGTTVDLTATLQGGRYDDLDYAWAVTGGDLDDDDAVSPEWTRPSVSADTDYTITLTVTARGTGRNARADTEAESTRASRTARVTDTTAQLPVASAPTVTIDAVSAGREGTTVDLTATLQGGRYDDLDYAWAVTGGDLDDDDAVSPEWTRPSVSADTDYTITLTVTARGTGRNARTGTSQARTASSRTARVTNTPTTPTNTGWSWVTFTDTVGSWSGTSTYRGSCASRERLYRRSTTRRGTQERYVNGVRRTRSHSQTVDTDTDWRSSPSSGVWTGWSRVGTVRSVLLSVSGTSTYRGSCSSRERRYTERWQDVWTEERTNPCQTKQSRTRTRNYTGTQWRSAPTSGVWSSWREVSRRTVHDPQAGTYTDYITEERTNPCQPTQRRTRTETGM